MVSPPIDKQKLAELKAFIALLEQNPSVIHQSELAFFREYMENHGAKFAMKQGMADTTEKEETPTQESKSTETPEEVISEDEVDSEKEEMEDYEQEDACRMQPEIEEMPPLCYEKGELSDEQLDKVNELKQQYMEAIQEGNLAGAVDKMNEVFSLSNPTALIYCKRADLLLKLRRPVAAIRDCDEALKLNPDNGKAYRIRGSAHRYLGNWEDAHRDIETGQKIDYDESLDEIQKFVAEKWKAIDVKRRSSQRRREERMRRNKLRQRRRQQAAARRAYEQAKREEEAGTDEDDAMPNFSGTPNGFPGGAGGPGGLMNNPEMKKAMENPKVLQAVMELMQNPAAFSKYQNDPEVMNAFSSLMGSMGGGAGVRPPPQA